MPSTYSANTRLELMATGENSNTWGQKTNNNLNLISDATNGYLAVDLGNGGTTVLTANNGSADQTRQAILKFQGALTSAAIAEVVGGVEGKWIVHNSCLGSQTVTFRVSGGTGVELPFGTPVQVYSDGTSVFSLGTAASISATYIFTNKLVATEVSASVLNAVSVNASTVSATLGNITAFSATTISVSVVSATQVSATRIFATSVSATLGAFAEVVAASAVVSAANIVNQKLTGTLITGAATTATGYANAGDITLPATGAIRGKNTAKVWVTFNNAGTILDSFGVASVTKNTNGLFTVTFSTAFANTNYCAVANCNANPGSHNAYFANTFNYQPGSIQVATNNTAGLSDSTQTSLIIFGA